MSPLPAQGVDTFSLVACNAAHASWREGRAHSHCVCVCVCVCGCVFCGCRRFGLIFRTVNPNLLIMVCDKCAAYALLARTM
jgi:hypothetical protein